jgi:hypothetical protein
MTVHTAEFPFEEIARFNSWREACDAGYADTQVWSVVEEDGIWVYGAPHHRINVLYWVATAEHHDGDTYYEEPFDEDLASTEDY